MNVIILWATTSRQRPSFHPSDSVVQWNTHIDAQSGGTPITPGPFPNTYSLLIPKDNSESFRLGLRVGLQPL